MASHCCIFKGWKKDGKQDNVDLQTSNDSETLVSANKFLLAHVYSDLFIYCSGSFPVKATLISYNTKHMAFCVLKHVPSGLL